MAAKDVANAWACDSRSLLLCINPLPDSFSPFSIHFLLLNLSHTKFMPLPAQSTPVALGPGRSMPRQRAPKTKWTESEEYQLVDGLASATIEGKLSDGGYKSSVWTAIAESIEDPLKNDKVCRTRWEKLKADYRQVKFVRELSGFGWDEVEQLPTAEEELWEELKRVWQHYIPHSDSLTITDI